MAQKNVMLEWETSEVTSEPLSIIKADNPVTCALYSANNNMIEKERWKQFKSIAKRQNKLLQVVNQAKIISICTSPCYKYGFEVLWDYSHAIELDKRNRNSWWQEAT